MAEEKTGHSPQPSEEAQQDLQELRSFSGSPSDFWRRFLDAASRLVNAKRGVLILKKAGDEPLKKIGEWPQKADNSPVVLEFSQVLGGLAGVCADKEKHLQSVGSSDPEGLRNFAVGIRLKLDQEQDVCVGAFLLTHITLDRAQEMLARLELIADLPVSFQAAGRVEKARLEAERMAVAMDVLAEVNEEKRFLSSTLALCNSVATKFQCDRVSLGWLQGGYIKMQSISRTEKFEKNMSSVTDLEAAMEEAHDQDEEIVFPSPQEATFVNRDHEKFARSQAVDFICSTPLRSEEEPVAVLTCERQSGAFTEVELQQLRLIGDQVIPRLADLKKNDRWFGARMAASCKEKASKILGPEHTWAKVLTVLIATLLAILFFVRVPYRVEADFIIRSEEVSFLTAPYNGYIDEVLVKMGDLVKKDQPLLRLNTEDLLLEEASAIADLNRYRKEAEKSRAAGKLAEMQIAQALGEQSEARWELIRHRLELAEVKVAFEGFVVEGDLEERIGAPVSQGDALYRVARLDRLYVEAEVDEADIHEIIDSESAEIALFSRPNLKFPMKVTRIEPAAVPRTDGNRFMVRLEFEDEIQDWWRPGMAGLSKINVEKRTLAWIFTHKTVDFLRMWLWW